jgi:hypothetical protein
LITKRGPLYPNQAAQLATSPAVLKYQLKCSEKARGSDRENTGKL